MLGKSDHKSFPADQFSTKNLDYLVSNLTLDFNLKNVYSKPFKCAGSKPTRWPAYALLS